MYLLRVETGSTMVSMTVGNKLRPLHTPWECKQTVTWLAWLWAANQDHYILPESGNQQWHGQHDSGQQIETITYKLRVETGNVMVNLTVSNELTVSY